MSPLERSSWCQWHHSDLKTAVKESTAAPLREPQLLFLGLFNCGWFIAHEEVLLYYNAPRRFSPR
jgi:hypothetical protein